MSLDNLFSKVYDEDHYNCAHFVADAWEAETGQSIRSALDGFLLPASDRKADMSANRQLRPLKAPRSPCIVLMRSRKAPPHVGIYLRGRVGHIKKCGVAFQPLRLATLGFSTVRFYGT
jgi:hypothetical protein